MIQLIVNINCKYGSYILICFVLDFRAVGLPMLPIPPSTQIPPPVEKSQYKYQRSKSEDVIEDNIAIDKRKRWLEEQIQKTTTTSEKSKSDVFQDNLKIVKAIKISDDSISSISDKEVESHQLQQESNLKSSSFVKKNDGDCIDGVDNRGNAYKLPSQIRHSKSVDLDVTTQNCIKVNEGAKKLDNYNENTFLKKQNIANDSKILEYRGDINNIPLNSFQMPQNNSAENSSNKPHFYNNSNANDIQKTDKEVLTSIQSVKDVAKLFQATTSTTDTLVNRRSNVNKGNNARPKSYHPGVFNQYDWASRDSVSKATPDNKSDNVSSNLSKNKFGSTNNLSDQAKKIGVTLIASDLENIVFESNVTSTKSASNRLNLETNNTSVSYGMKNTRIIEEIAETERREREIREERSKRFTVDVGGDSNKNRLANFLKENEIHI